MRKINAIVILTFLMAFSYSNASAKGDSKKDDKPARIGVRAGWNYSAMFVDGDMPQGTDHLNSFYLGVFKEKKMVPFLRLGSGIEYLRNGYKISDEVQRELNYISIPLYLKLKIGPVYATGGTGFNFRVSENLPGSTVLDPLNNEKSNFFDMPFQLGAGLKILMFSFELRYNWGMLKANNEAYNQYLQAGFTVSF